jgi:hypothetical protein
MKHEIPNDLGGLQHIETGPLQDGDVWVWQGKPQCLVNAHLFPTAEEAVGKYPEDWHVYRRIPVPGHVDDKVNEVGVVMVEPNKHYVGSWEAGQPEAVEGMKEIQKEMVKIMVDDIRPLLHSSKPSNPINPKDIAGSDKIPLHLWPTTASALGSLALLDGALKYGRTNYRAVGVRASIYYDAMNRHMNAWFEGEDADPSSGLPHLAHALACIAILVDSEAAGKLNDDRMIAGGHRALMDDLTPHVARLKALYKDRDPKHYNIQDSKVLDNS